LACATTMVHIIVNLFLMMHENIRLLILRYKKYKKWRNQAKVKSEKIHKAQKKERLTKI
jgi:hypothetical protein